MGSAQSGPTTLPSAISNDLTECRKSVKRLFASNTILPTDVFEIVIEFSLGRLRLIQSLGERARFDWRIKPWKLDEHDQLVCYDRDQPTTALTAVPKFSKADRLDPERALSSHLGFDEDHRYQLDEGKSVGPPSRPLYYVIQINITKPARSNEPNRVIGWGAYHTNDELDIPLGPPVNARHVTNSFFRERTAALSPGKGHLLLTRRPIPSEPQQVLSADGDMYTQIVPLFRGMLYPFASPPNRLRFATILPQSVIPFSFQRQTPYRDGRVVWAEIVDGEVILHDRVKEPRCSMRLTLHKRWMPTYEFFAWQEMYDFQMLYVYPELVIMVLLDFNVTVFDSILKKPITPEVLIVAMPFEPVLDWNRVRLIWRGLHAHFIRTEMINDHRGNDVLLVLCSSTSYAFRIYEKHYRSLM